MRHTSHYFIGIEIPQEIKEQLFTFSNQCTPKEVYKHWTHLSDFHITLSFLGAISEKELEVVKQSLVKIKRMATFEAKIIKLSTFGAQKRPRVFFAEVEKTKSLVQLYTAVQNEMHTIFKQKEQRTFTPHITIAKKWNPLFDWSDFQMNDLLKLPIAFTVKTVHLFQVQPKQNPKYRVIKTYNLYHKEN